MEQASLARPWTETQTVRQSEVATAVNHPLKNLLAQSTESGRPQPAADPPQTLGQDRMVQVTLHAGSSLLG